MGIIIDDDLKWTGYIDRITWKANMKLGMLKRKFLSSDLGLWKDLYVSLVRSLFEYAVQAWNSHLEEDIDRIERVQRRASIIPFGFEKL